MGSEIVRLWTIIQNIFSYVRQKQVSHMGLEQHESDKMIYILFLWWTMPLSSCFYSPAMFAFHPKYHVFLTHLTCLGEPWLCRKPINAHTHTQNHLYVSGTEFNNNFHRFCSIKESIGGGETCEWQPARCLSWGEPEVSCGGRYLESDRTDRDSLNESLQLIKYL